MKRKNSNSRASSIRFYLCLIITISAYFSGCSSSDLKNSKISIHEIEEGFKSPPDSVRPWVLWDWISNNVTKEGITNDLVSMKGVGVGGVVWRGIGGKYWAPKGDVPSYSTEWYDLMQWAIVEAERLGIKFSVSQDFGYGSGGPHITPDNSMQQLVWNDTILEGGSTINISLDIPTIPNDNIAKAWLRPGGKLSDKVLNDIEQIDSYRDIALLAVPYSFGEQLYRFPQFNLRTGMGKETHFKSLNRFSPPREAIINFNEIINLSELTDKKGNLSWNAPAGKWRIIRLGHASNFLMTRPSPADAVGLECDRLSKNGIDTHFDNFVRQILDNASFRTGETLPYLFLDSWEAGSQNWTKKMPGEFKKRRGYDITPWLPVLTGAIVESVDMTERFLWDFRKTVNELFLDNYLYRLQELIKSYNMQFLVEAYGTLNINTMQYAEMGDFPVSEFWTLGDDTFPEIKSDKYFNSMKAMASAAHTMGKTHVGAEAFTGSRGWKDHPFIFKGVGDEAFCRGVNHFILHLSAHQAYENMVPGLTHQKWGGHFNRFNTLWEYSKPWFDYLSRAQFLLKQGQFVADVCYFFGEGAPINLNDMALDLPPGFDYDLCSADIIHQMTVNKGIITLPSGISYRYLLLPDHEYMELASMRKIDKLARAGAKVIAQKKIVGTPGLEGFPENDEEVRNIFEELSKDNLIQFGANWEATFKNDKLPPDFIGKGLDYIHRRTEDMDIFFISNQMPENVETLCSFRTNKKTPELWNPETGEIHSITDFIQNEGLTSFMKKFEPMQSWFVIFHDNIVERNLSDDALYSDYQIITEITSPWEVRFDSNWGGPKNPVTFDSLVDWSKHDISGIRFYSGSATYENIFILDSKSISESNQFFIDLGKVEVMAKVHVNGKECGIAWKPPYRIDISEFIHSGENLLEVDVVNTWVNRMIGDEHLPEDSEWIGWIRLKKWPRWLQQKESRRSGRYTFTTAKHYDKDDQLESSGLLGPVKVITKNSAQNLFIFSEDTTYTHKIDLSSNLEIFDSTKINRSIEAFADRNFKKGITLFSPTEGVLLVDTILSFGYENLEPVWNVRQWASKFSLKNAELEISPHGDRIYRNKGKTLAVNPDGSFQLEVFGKNEWGNHYRQRRESWPHLYLTQSFFPRVKIPIAKCETIFFSLDGIREYCYNYMHPSADTSLYTAHVVINIIVQNRNTNSPLHGKYITVQLPCYDYRYDFAKSINRYDVDGKEVTTGSLMYGMPSEELWDGTFKDGKWHKARKDILPLILEAWPIATKKGSALEEADLNDFYLASATIGWEVPGIFDASMRFKNLSIRAVLKE